MLLYSPGGISLTRQGDKQGKASVTFQSGRVEDFDIVVVADGVRSRTRRLVFGDEVKFKRLGMCECLSQSSSSSCVLIRAPYDVSLS